MCYLSVIIRHNGFVVYSNSLKIGPMPQLLFKDNNNKERGVIFQRNRIAPTGIFLPGLKLVLVKEPAH